MNVQYLGRLYVLIDLVTWSSNDIDSGSPF